MFTLAHLSDVHLAPMKAPGLRELASKRFYGYQSWQRRRRFIHLRAIVDLMVEDIRSAVPDHVALTGDLVNLATRSEFEAAAAWLDRFGPPEWITVVPGNHDAYVPVPWESGQGLWDRFMAGDLAIGREKAPVPRFPFVRTRRNVALIGLSTAVPTPAFMASGRLGPQQLTDLERLLPVLRDRGFFRVILIHHPPLPGASARRKALEDAHRLKVVLEHEGAELVLHGHDHEHSLTQIMSRTGPVHIVGVPSASALGRRGKPPAAWYHYAVARTGGRWTCEVTIRSYHEETKRFVEGDRFSLTPGTDRPRVLTPVGLGAGR